MKTVKIVSYATLMSLVLLLAMLSMQPNEVEAGRKKILRQAALAALLLHSGKKILVPLPLPLPVPFLRQTQPVYYEQPHYEHNHHY